MSVTAGVLASAALAGAVNTAALASNAVTGAKITSYSDSRSNNGTTTNETASKIQTGWEGGTLTGTSSKFSFSVTFPSAFTSPPIVVATGGGDQSSGSIVYGSGGDIVQAQDMAKAVSITTTGFTLILYSGSSSWVLGNVVYAQWIAIGT
jgi:hypothetical protein